MKISVIAPSAPPKNSAEALQVGRYIDELQRNNNVHLITTHPEAGWAAEDASVYFERPPVTTLLRLPLHRWSSRLLGSRYLRAFAIPDASLWIRWYQRKAAAAITQFGADIIYARAAPFSALLLGWDLQSRTGLPLVLHLSDPWSDSPYLSSNPVIEEMESRCLHAADAVTVTTPAIQSFYAEKYPQLADRISVSPNVAPTLTPAASVPAALDNNKLNLVYAGSFYGERQPTGILHALETFQHQFPEAAGLMRVRFAGNAPPEVERAIRACEFDDVEFLGKIPYQAATQLQLAADVLLSIEPNDNHPLNLAILPSKIVEYLPLQKPILALTANGSQTAGLVSNRFGWTAEPAAIPAIVKALREMVEQWQQHQLGNGLPPVPTAYQVPVAVAALRRLFEKVRGEGP